MKTRRLFYITMLLELIFMNVVQVGFILYTELYVDKTDLCGDDGFEKASFSFVIHCKPYMIGVVILLRSSLVALQIYFICIIR